MKNNKQIGNYYENLLASILSSNGFWVYQLPNKKSGQPFDVIAVKNKKAYAYECKHCSTNIFNTRRIEGNQHMAMQFWKSKGNGEAYFVFFHDNEITLAEYSKVKNNFNITAAMRLEEWLNHESNNI